MVSVYWQHVFKLRVFFWIIQVELLAGLAILLAPVSSATDRVKMMFQAHDADGNDRLSEAEVLRLLHDLDYDDATRFRQCLRHGAADSHEDLLASLLYDREVGTYVFKLMDTNGDGQVTFDEFLATVRSNRTLCHLVLDQDYWSPAARVRFQQGGPAVSAPQSQAKKKQVKRVSLLQQRFSQADVNQDGSLDLAEYREMMMKYAYEECKRFSVGVLELHIAR